LGAAAPLGVGPLAALFDLLGREPDGQQAHGDTLLDSGLHLQVNAVRPLRLEQVEQVPALAPLIVDLHIGLGLSEPEMSLLVMTAHLR
jgi:hypothetical protein